MLRLTTSSAHLSQSKLQLILNFHCVFSSDSILILCLKMERCDYYDNLLLIYDSMVTFLSADYAVNCCDFLIFSKSHHDFANFLP